MLLEGHVRTTDGAAVTVKTAEQVLGPSHVLVTVQVTVLEPPHLSGADPPLFESVALHPPLKVAEFNHAV